MRGSRDGETVCGEGWQVVCFGVGDFEVDMLGIIGSFHFWHGK